MTPSDRHREILRHFDEQLLDVGRALETSYLHPPEVYPALLKQARQILEQRDRYLDDYENGPRQRRFSPYPAFLVV